MAVDTEPRFVYKLEKKEPYGGNMAIIHQVDENGNVRSIITAQCGDKEVEEVRFVSLAKLLLVTGFIFRELLMNVWFSPLQGMKMKYDIGIW